MPATAFLMVGSELSTEKAKQIQVTNLVRFFKFTRRWHSVCVTQLAFEVMLNIHTVPEVYTDAWLKTSGNTITFFVVDTYTNIIMAMRTFSIPPIMAEQIRDCLEKQDMLYDDAIEVDLRMEAIRLEVPLQMMFERGKMYRIG